MGDIVTVYVDNFMIQASVPNGNRTVRGRWSHLMADSDEELIEFAKSIGLNPAWIQEPSRRYGAHFDVTASKRLAAIRAGAVAVDWHDMPKLMDQLAKVRRKAARKKRLTSQQP